MKIIPLLDNRLFLARQKIPARWLHPRYVSLLALAVLLLFWSFVPFRENGGFADYPAFYRPAADNLLAGKGYVQGDERLATRYPPGFPLLLALLEKIALALNLPRAALLALLYAGCFCASARLIYALAVTWWKPASAFLVSVAWMTYLPLLWLTTQPFTETPYLLLFLSGLWLFWRGIAQASPNYLCSYLFGCGLLLGGAALIRPMGSFIGFALIFCLFALRSRFKLTWKNAWLSVVLLMAGQLTIWLPWQGYAYAHSGRVFFLSTAFVPAMRDGLRFAVNQKGYRQPLALPDDVLKLMERINTRSEEMETSRQVIKIVTEEGRSTPFAAVKLYAIKMARAWYATDSASRETPLLLLQIFYLSLIATAIWRGYRAGILDSRWGWIIALVLLGSWGTTTLVLSILRYMTPAISLLFLFLPGLWHGATQAEPATNE